MKYSEEDYTDDLLGDGFEQLTMHFKDDFEGKVVATLIRSKTL